MRTVTGFLTIPSLFFDCAAKIACQNLRGCIFDVNGAIIFLSLTPVLLNGYRHLERCLQMSDERS